MQALLRRVLAVLLLVLVVASLAPGPVQASDQAPRRRPTPVIFLPGIGGSELSNGGELIWINPWRLLADQIPILSLFNLGWLQPLRLKPDGVSPYRPSYRIRVGDVMRDGLTDAYSGLLDDLAGAGYDVRVMPYDWRRDPHLVAADLGRLVDQTLRETGAGQVVLIGHSLGGLVARDYMVSGGASRVKALIAIGTPWLGVPLAYRALAYGWDLGVKVPGTNWGVLAPKDVHLLVQNYPSVYALAPGRRFWDWYPEGYLTRDGRDLTYGQTLTDGLKPHNRGLAEHAAGYTDRLLDGSDHGVKQYLIAGTGRPTVTGFAEQQDWLGFTEMTERHAMGDEVVPLYSADLGFSTDPARAGTYLGKLTGVAYVSGTHHHFLAQSDLTRQTVLHWLATVQP